MDELEKIRNEINLVDERILDALANRRKLAEQVIRAKDQLGTPIRDAGEKSNCWRTSLPRGAIKGLTLTWLPGFSMRSLMIQSGPSSCTCSIMINPR